MSQIPILLAMKCEAGDVADVEKLLKHGLELCGGEDRGVCALTVAAEKGHRRVLELLSGAGVRDDGEALMRAIIVKNRDSIMFLVKHYERHSLAHVLRDTRTGVLILFKVLEYFSDPLSPRLMHWLVGVGANTAPRVLVFQRGGVAIKSTARELVASLKQKHTREEVPTLYAMDRLLKQEEAVKALSWRWPGCECSSCISKRTRDSRVLSRAVYMSRNATSRVVLQGLLRYTRKSF